MHPNFFHLPAYGLCVAAGILAAVALALLLIRLRPARPSAVVLGVDFVLDAAVLTIVAGFVAARAAYLVLDPAAFLRHPVASLLNSGGGVWLAGLAGGLVSLAWLARRRGAPFAAAADLLAAPAALGHAFGRLGCHFAGCCHGCVVGDPPGALARFAAIQYPSGSWAWQGHAAAGWIPPDAPASLPVWPVPLLEAAADVVIAAALATLWLRRAAPPGRPSDPASPGAVAMTYAAAYGAVRFALEFLRGDTARGTAAGLSTSQWIILAAAASTAIFASVRAILGRRPIPG